MNNLAVAIEWKLRKLNKFDGAKIETESGTLSKWVVDGMDQPDNSTLQSWCDEYESTGLVEANFSTFLMLGAMGLAFTGADAVNLAPYLSAIQNYADFKNFKGIKDFIAGLVALGKVTQSQADSLYAIFLQQGINLGSY